MKFLNKISKAEIIFILFYMLLIAIALFCVLFIPNSSYKKHDFSFIISSFIISVIIYVSCKYLIFAFIKTCIAIWYKSDIWEYRKKFLLYVVHSLMYVFTLLSLIYVLMGLRTLDLQLAFYSYGLMGVLIGGVTGKEHIPE